MQMDKLSNEELIEQTIDGDKEARTELKRRADIGVKMEEKLRCDFLKERDAMKWCTCRTQALFFTRYNM
jgi:hypothetical protein